MRWALYPCHLLWLGVKRQPSFYFGAWKKRNKPGFYFWSSGERSSELLLWSSGGKDKRASTMELRKTAQARFNTMELARKHRRAFYFRARKTDNQASASEPGRRTRVPANFSGHSAWTSWVHTILVVCPQDRQPGFYFGARKKDPGPR